MFDEGVQLGRQADNIGHYSADEGVGEVAEKLPLRAPGQALDQLLGRAFHIRLQLVHGLGGEGLVDQGAQAGVLGRVFGQQHAAAALVVKPGRAEHDFEAA